MRLILAVHHIKRHSGGCLLLVLVQGIFDQEDLLFSVNVEVFRKVGAEDVGILGRCEKVHRELREPVDLVPHDLALPLFVLNPLVDKAAAAGNPLKHLSQVIVEVHVLFSSLVEGELILEMLNDIFLINYLNEPELPI